MVALRFMTPHSEDITLDHSPGELDQLDDAIRQLLTALHPIDNHVSLITEVVAAWADLDFDDRRAVGQWFPRLTNALLSLEARVT